MDGEMGLKPELKGLNTRNIVLGAELVCFVDFWATCSWPNDGLVGFPEIVGPGIESHHPEAAETSQLPSRCSLMGTGPEPNPNPISGTSSVLGNQADISDRHHLFERASHGSLSKLVR